MIPDRLLFLSSDSKWPLLLGCTESEVDDLRESLWDDGVICRVVRGKNCETIFSLCQEWSAALQFPWYFGGNWDAFDECINDLSWLHASNFIVFLTHANMILPNSDREWDAFVSILKDASDEWSKKVITDSHGKHKSMLFRIVFHCDSAKMNSLRERFGANL